MQIELAVSSQHRKLSTEIDSAQFPDKNMMAAWRVPIIWKNSMLVE